MLENIANKQVLVLGLGKSGRSAVRLLLAAGAAGIRINDQKGADLLQEEIKELSLSPEVQIVTGTHRGNLLDNISLIVKSPGIHPRLPLLQEAASRGIRIVSEIEPAYHLCPVPLAAVTGTNGKTTTVALAGAMFRQKFPHVQVAGNIGFPLGEAVLRFGGRDDPAGGYIVAELSSFQLADIGDFRAHIAAVLNISADHLDYHGSMDEYITAKRNIFNNQQPGDWSILNRDDPPAWNLAPFTRGRLLPFSRHRVLTPGVFIKNGYMLVNDGREDIPVCPVEKVRIPGQHNLENALAATAVSWAAGVPVDRIARSLDTFPGVPHRLEEVAVIRGVRYINDSKGTNPESTLKAVQAVSGPKILIAGGLNKGISFAPLAQALAGGGVKLLLLLGEAAPLLEKAARAVGFNAIMTVADLPAAVRQAARQAGEGEAVLLSPACASWDMFRDYEERGEVFRREVDILKEDPGEH